MIGGLGNDTYIVDSAGDIVTETSTVATEVDTVQSSVSYVLGANLENLILTGSAVINGTGNSLNNAITGNAANNILNGGAGKDIMIGGLGRDTFVYQNLTDSVLSNFDVITDFNATTGNDLFRVATTPTGFVNVGAVNTLDPAGIGAKLTGAVFGSNFAAQFSFGQRTFVAINNAIAGFNPDADSIIEVTGLTGILTTANFTI
jgi:Ca2+-binding RTX toxin-like protein